MLRDGVRRVPESELLRAGLIDLDEAASANLGEAPDASADGVVTGSLEAAAAASASPEVVIDVNALVSRIETLTAEAAQHRLIASQSETLLGQERSRAEALEAALHETRAELEELRAHASELQETATEVEALRTILASQAATPRPSFWQRLFGRQQRTVVLGELREGASGSTTGHPAGPEPDPGPSAQNGT